MTGLSAHVVVERGTFTLDAEIEARPGEVVALLGPNGAGKTTLLRALAGLTPLSRGTLTLDHRSLDEPATTTFVPVEERPIGLVFQDYRLFPHLSVLDNVAFGPRSRGRSRQESRSTAAQWLDRLHLTTHAKARPKQLSGGQAQRVALARALATEPALLLLDEPLSALDAQTRHTVRSTLQEHLADFAGPTVLVTHDPLEAMVLADRLVVVEGGRVVQAGAPADVARRPATAYVARLMGLNLYAGRGDGRMVTLSGGGKLVAADAMTGDLLLAVRPSAFTVGLARSANVSSRNGWRGVVGGMELLGDRVRLQVEGEPPALVDVTPAAVAELELRPGRAVWLSVKATEVEAYPA